MSDLISRQAAIDALAEWHDVAITNRLNNLPPAQPSVSKTETVEDCISRQAAIDAVRHAWAKGLEPMQFLEDLPSAQPEQRWIPVTERMPGEFVSVQAHMTDAEPFPSVREAYLAGGEWFFPALSEYHPVDKWAEFLESPEEKCYVQEKVR